MLGLWWICLAGFAGSVLAQGSAVRPSDLPSVDAETKIPALDSPAPDFSDAALPESPSIPKLRAPEKEPEKTKDQDWAAQAMLQKKEEAKRQEEQQQAALAEKKSRESQEAINAAQKEKAEKAANNAQPVVAKSAAPGFSDGESQKLPAVTGLEGVKPRAMASGDGRVQPSFDAYTGPSTSSPLDKDFQSGAKPIMPGTPTVDGRISMPPKVPEPPSGGYKRISEDPYSLPSGYGQKTASPPTASKPVVIPPNPPTGDTKRAIVESKAGYSPYDNTKKVPDPRSQRRF